MLLPSPSIFFFQITENEKTKIRYGRSTKQKSRNNALCVPQEVSRQRDSRNSLLTPYRLINDQDTYNDSYDVFIPVYEYGLKLSHDKNSVGVKELPVVITSLHYYKQSGNIRYKVASKDGHITGTYGREELRPQQHITAKLMGIDIASLGKGTNAALTPLQAHSRYLPIGGKNTKCRCKTDCSKLSTCSCRKAGKLCTKHCHKNNTICTWCDTQQ
jgi:hypothetical protein